MRPDPINDRAPGGETRGNGYTHNTVSVSTGTDNGTPAVLPIIDAAEVEEHLTGALVLLVRTTSDRHRRRVFLSVAAAQRAADRALEAGHAAEVVLCRLEPVGAVL